MIYLKNIIIIAEIGGRAYSNEIARAKAELQLFEDIAELAPKVTNDFDENYEAMQVLLKRYEAIKNLKK